MAMAGLYYQDRFLGRHCLTFVMEKVVDEKVFINKINTDLKKTVAARKPKNISELEAGLQQVVMAKVALSTKDSCHEGAE